MYKTSVCLFQYSY